MEHLSHKSRLTAVFLSLGMLMFFFFSAPTYAQSPTPSFKSTSPYRIANPDYSTKQADPSSFGHQTYRSTIYTPFGSSTPSSGNGSGGSSDSGNSDDDDIGIPGWADTPSEPLPIGDTVPLFLFTAAMIAMIAIKQRRKQLQTTTQTSNTTNNDSSMHTTRHISSNRLQKLFLLLAFVCFVGQVSGQTVYKTQIFVKKASNITNFPKGTNTNYGKLAYQAGYTNDAFYAADWGYNRILHITQTTCNNSWKTGISNLRAGACCDDVGNFITHTSSDNTKPTTLTIYNNTLSTTYTISFTSLGGQCNLISAKGDVLNGTGYVYFFPSGLSTVKIVEINKGKYVKTHSISELTISAPSGGGYVIPIEGTTRFLYQDRQKGFYYYNESNKGLYLSATSSDDQPACNKTFGGAVFKLGSTEYFVYPSGFNYNGGWSICKLNDKSVLWSQAELGSGGYNENSSTGEFFTIKRINDYTVELYEYCQGNGIAEWTLRGSISKDVRIQTHDGNATGANKSANWGDNVNGGTIKFAYYANSTNASSTTTANITTGGYKYYTDVNPDKNITLTATPNSEYTFIGWWNNGATYTANPWTHVAKNSNQSITARFAKLKQQTINIHTYDTESNTYIANAIGGTVTVSYNNALTEDNTSATLSSTSGSYKALINSTVTLTATPKSGYVFVGWYKGDEHLDWATTNECSFKADNAYNITARFTKLVTQTFKVQTYESTAYADGGNGGTMTVNYNDGTTATVTNSTSISNLYQGYNVTLTANAKIGYKFMGWFNNDFTTEYSKGSNTYTYRGEGTRTIHARFRKTYNQTVNISTYNPATGQYVSGGDGGIVTSVTYDDGNAQSLSDVTNSTFTPLVNTHVTVTAESKSGYKFDGWYSGETLLSEDAEYTYTVNAAKTITARFVKSDIQLVVAVKNYNTDYAEFVEYPHDNNTVTIANGGNTTTVTSSTSAIVNYGSQVTLTANNDDRDDGYDFIGWYQNNKRISQETSYTFTITDHSAISAHFAPKKCHKVLIKASLGGIYTVKYAREKWFDTEGMYYTATSQYKNDIEIHVPYEAQISVINPQPIHGYSYLGFKVFKGTKDENKDIYTIKNYNPNDIPQIFANFVRTDEQVVYLDISNKDVEGTIWNNVAKFGCNLRTNFTNENQCISGTKPFEALPNSNTLYKVTIPAEDFECITIHEMENATNCSSSPEAIPATRYNCYKLNAYKSSTGEWVDAWTTLDTENGDYRLIYIEQKVMSKTEITRTYEFNEGDRIKKVSSGKKTDIVSLHIYNKVSKDNNGNLTGTALNNPEIILQQWDGTTWVDIERHMVFGPLQTDNTSNIRMPGRKNTVQVVVDKGIDAIKAEKDDAIKDYGSGVWNFYITQENGNVKLELDKTKKYTGKYYIRTTNADGQYNNFTHPNNVMTPSEYAKKNSDFSHYFIRYVDIYEDGTPTATAGKHPVVKFTIANEHAMFLCKELMINNNRFTDDEYGDDLFVKNVDGAPNLPADATVRFGWDIVTNRLTRAYIANTDFKNNEYLVVEGTNITDISGNTLQAQDEATYFNENGDFFYQIDVKAKVGATANVKAKYNGKYQYFMGSEGKQAPLLSGSGSGTYPVRILYDFKNDRFMTFCELEGNINGTVALNTSVMIMREHNHPPTRLTFDANASVTATTTNEDQYTKPAYAVMTFLEDKLLDNNVSKYEKMFYWISFPFDVKISDVFGLGEYGKYWIMEEYDGKQRSENGLAQTNWKYITKKSHVLKQNVGYVLCLNYSQILQDQLFKSHGAGEFGHSKLSLYFPSNSVISPAMLKGGQTVNRTLEQMESNATAWNHHNWHLIGVPSFATPGFESKQDNIPFLYQYWHPGDAYAAVTPNDVTFHAMHSFMVQYYGNITWTSVVNTGTPLSIAAKKDADADKKVMLRLELQQAGSTLDKTYVQLRNDKGTKGFDMSLDLTKIINAGANIYSIVDNHEMAGNAIPKDETVLPLGVVITAAGEYTFAMPQGTEGMIVELIDYEQGTSTNLLMSDYTITLNKGTFNQRFALRLVPDKTATSVEDITGDSNDDNVRKLLIDGVLYLQQSTNTYDAQGHAIR